MNTVDEFISQLRIDWQKQRCAQLYKLQSQVSEDIVGEIKWENPYFSVNGKYLLKWYVGKSHINVYFAKGIELDDPRQLFDPTANKKMRSIKLFEDSKLDEKAYQDLVDAAVQKSE